MTALAIGKKNNITFAVIDAMVQGSTEIKNYKDCRLVDKTTNISSADQHILLCGEELIANAAWLLNDWSERNDLKLDLFKKHNFLELLKCADIYRNFCVDIRKDPLIAQDATDVYIIDSDRIKHYNVTRSKSEYIIVSELDFADGFCTMNFKGAITKIDIKVDGNIEQNAIKLLESHQRFRIKTGYKSRLTPLAYNFHDRFSSIIYLGNGERIIRSPFNTFSEMLLSYNSCWDYVNRPAVKYEPKII